MINLELMKLRARNMNNDRQHNRMVEDKRRSFHRALLYSYQTSWIKKDGDENADYIRALINPDKVKFDYDEKIVSIDSIHEFKGGDTFEWKGTDTHWLILKQELTELAYFRGSIRRCQLLQATDPESGEIFELWAAIRGPVETKINVIQKGGVSAEVPNLSLNIYMTLTEQTRRTFARHAVFSFMGKYWEVNAYDHISTPNILEITAVETYDCGDHIQVEKVDPNPPVDNTTYCILGDTFVRPFISATFECQDLVKYNWSISLPVGKTQQVSDVLSWEVDQDNKLHVVWNAVMSGSYIIDYGPYSKTIIVESLF